MAQINATILIPDISGYTEFVTTTELSHGSRTINMLIDAIVNAVGEEYEVSEIEGDAVLLIKKDPAPSKKELLDFEIEKAEKAGRALSLKEVLQMAENEPIVIE